MPEVSVIIAAWNAEASIERAVTSALTQTGVEVEVLVADDASSDGTAQVVARLTGERLRYLRLPANRGPGGARNAALAAARGEWVAVLDADDFMMPGRLHKLLSEGEGADIVADNLWVTLESAPERRRLLFRERLDGGSEVITLAHFVRHNLLFRKVRGYGYLKPLFRRTFIERHGLRYDESLRIAEDYHLVLHALVHGARYRRSRSAGYVYAKHAGSISHRLGQSELEAMVAADRRFLKRYGSRLSRADRGAVQDHLKSLLDGLAFTVMLGHAKERRWAELAALVMIRPWSARHFAMPINARLQRALQRLR